MPVGLAGFYDPSKTFEDNFTKGPFPYKNDLKAYQNTGEPKYEFLGKKIYSPFGIAAGPLPTNKHIKYAFDLGFDVVCYKTQRSVPFPCNDFPNVLFLEVD